MKCTLNDGVANSWSIKMLNNHSVKTYKIYRTKKKSMQEENAEISLGGTVSQEPMESIIMKVYLATNCPSAPLENITFVLRKNKRNFKQTKKEFLN